MDDRLVVIFEAHHPERNHHRWYEMAVGRDLFGDWTVTIRYGRIGQRGQERRYPAATAAAGRAIIRAHLLRRLTAPGRIGCEYRLVGSVGERGVDPEEWLPVDVMARLRVRPSARPVITDPMGG